MNTQRYKYVVIAALLVLAPLFVSAQTSDTFEISQVVTGIGDVTPPTVPTGLSAIAVSTSQVDLTWTASTDDVAVVGYQVFRDGIFIATSTPTNYSDVGLIANTSYEYTVTAFDAALNISGHSATATATTLTEQTGGGTGSRRNVISIFDVVITPGETSALVSWKTTMPARSRVSWGRTQDHESGTLLEVDTSVSHTAKLDGLTPDSRYYIEIVVPHRFGGVADRFTSSFVTGFVPDIVPPASPIDLQAVSSGDAIKLSWINPPDPDLEAIRVVRSDRFFPDTPFAGRVVFDGIDSSAADADVKQGVTYYYAAFARDTSGNYSAPAVASARLGESIADPFVEFPESAEIPESIEALSLLDFDFIQDGRSISFLGTTVPVDGTKTLTISIDYEKLPEVLKTIGVTLTDPEEKGKTFSFLLRIDEEKTKYTATLAPLGHSGLYGFTVTILDLKNQKLRTFEGNLDVSVREMLERSVFVGIPLSLVLLFLLILVFIIFLLGKFRESKDKEQHV